MPKMFAQYSHLNESFGEVSGGSVDSPSGEKTFANEDASLNDGAMAMDEACGLLSETLDLKPGEALLLLVEFDWDMERAQDAFLRDPLGLRHALGLPPPGEPFFQPHSGDKDRTCQICFCELGEILPCGHRFCDECWTQTIKVGCLSACLPVYLPMPESVGR